MKISILISIIVVFGQLQMYLHEDYFDDHLSFIIECPQCSSSERKFNCDTNNIYGGPNKFGKQASVKFNGGVVAIHKKVQLRFKLYTFGDWQAGNEVRIFFYNGSTTEQVVPGIPIDNNLNANFGCKEEIGQIQEITRTFDHLQPSLTIWFESNSNENADQYSWGIREMYINYYHSDTELKEYCPYGFYRNSFDCLKCTENCGLCDNDSAAGKCLHCKGTHYLNKVSGQEYGTCVLACPDGYYSKGNVCDKCADENFCNKCSAPPNLCELSRFGNQSTNTLQHLTQNTQPCPTPPLFSVSTFGFEFVLQPTSLDKDIEGVIWLTKTPEQLANCELDWDNCAYGNNIFRLSIMLNTLDAFLQIQYQIKIGQASRRKNEKCSLNQNLPKEEESHVKIKFEAYEINIYINNVLLQTCVFYPSDPNVASVETHSDVYIVLSQNDDQTIKYRNFYWEGDTYGTDNSALTYLKQQCVDCIDAYYLDRTDQTCKPCTHGCKQCLDNTLTQCTECEDGWGRVGTTCGCQEFVNPSDPTSGCNKPCESKQFLDANKICQNCNSKCSKCTGAGNKKCTECTDGYLLNDTSCETNCIRKYYYAGPNCELCHSNCEVCHGPGNDQCTLCADFFYLKCKYYIQKQSVVQPAPKVLIKMIIVNLAIDVLGIVKFVRQIVVASAPKTIFSTIQEIVSLNVLKATVTRLLAAAHLVIQHVMIARAL